MQCVALVPLSTASTPRTAPRAEHSQLWTAEDINASAALWNSSAQQAFGLQALEKQHLIARAACSNSTPGKILSTGAWCLTHRAAGPRGFLHFPRNKVSYPIPAHHQPASSRIVHVLLNLLRIPSSAASEERTRHLSLNDFGAGVGQYGAALERANPSIRWSGYDGAGNVEEWTQGMVRWFDLTQPLSLPRADWLLSLEVAEHVPRAHEGMLLRNLHAHNCVGLVVSWGVPGQIGHGHVNARDANYGTFPRPYLTK